MSEAGPEGPAPAAPGSSAAAEIPFPDVLRRLISERHADGSNLALLVIECGVIDRIDTVWGYHVGDAVHARAAATLRTEVLRADDLVAAIGRDDLACVLSAVDDSAVALLAAEKSLRALNAPIWIGEDEIYAHPSIGIAMFPAHGESGETLLQRAKSACSTARGLAERIAVYAEDLGNPETARLLRENRLRTAISEDTLELLFQPQYDLRLGQIMGAECLLGWRDVTFGVIPAGDAFDAAESAGMMNEFVSSLLNRALRNCSEFRYSAGLDLRICVNLPARALMHASLPDIIERSLGTWRLRPGRLVLEIGQTSMLEREPATLETLSRLKTIGVKLSIDDADVALSSLFALAAMPFREIKLDVSSASGQDRAAQSGQIMRSLIDLAHHLKLAVVAVGVPDDEAANRLKELGCDYMQGDYRGPALRSEAFVRQFGFSDG